MSSPRNLHAILILLTLLGFGVAAVVTVVKHKRSREETAIAPGSAAPASTGPGAGLERPPAAPAPPAGSGPPSKAQFVPAAAVVIPPELARKLEKQYRGVPPSSLELAHQKLTETLRVETQKHAPEDSLLALRREIAWLAERLPREE